MAIRTALGNDQLKILVVEDNRDAAEMLRCLLEVCGFQVTVAHTSQEGIEAARRQQPHIVLCDIGLPDSDGYTVGSVLRANRSIAAERSPRALTSTW